MTVVLCPWMFVTTDVKVTGMEVLAEKRICVPDEVRGTMMVIADVPDPCRTPVVRYVYPLGAGESVFRTPVMVVLCPPRFVTPVVYVTGGGDVVELSGDWRVWGTMMAKTDDMLLPSRIVVVRYLYPLGAGPSVFLTPVTVVLWP